MILVLGVWAFVRALLVNSAAVSLERRPASSTGHPAAIRPSPSASSPRPPLLALARAPVAGLTGQPPHRQACDSPRLAPQGFLLALEGPAPPSRSPGDRPRDPQPDL